MNLKEKANQYAIGKAEEAASQVIASAYIAGYEMGYNDGLAQLSIDNIEKSDYVDLGLPSGTLWSKEYVKIDEGQHSWHLLMQKNIIFHPRNNGWNY